jgi:hypothetical protein
VRDVSGVLGIGSTDTTSPPLRPILTHSVGSGQQGIEIGGISTHIYVAIPWHQRRIGEITFE